MDLYCIGVHIFFHQFFSIELAALDNVILWVTGGYMNNLSSIKTLPTERRYRPKVLDNLYPLEKECAAGQLLESRYAVSALAYPEIDPEAFRATYVDQGLTLPVFAAFNLRGLPEIRIVAGESAEQSGPVLNSVLGHLPLEAVRASHIRNENRRRMPLFALMCLGLGAGMATLYWKAWAAVTVLPLLGVPIVFFTIAAFIVAQHILLIFRDPRILTLTARFSGILPQDVREKAKSVQGEFGELYLIVDMQNRWEVSLAPAPLPKIDLDPLLVGSRHVNGKVRYFLIATFDLTMAEDYIKQEFTC